MHQQRGVTFDVFFSASLLKRAPSRYDRVFHMHVRVRVCHKYVRVPACILYAHSSFLSFVVLPRGGADHVIQRLHDTASRARAVTFLLWNLRPVTCAPDRRSKAVVITREIEAVTNTRRITLRRLRDLTYRRVRVRFIVRRVSMSP